MGENSVKNSSVYTAKFSRREPHIPSFVYHINEISLIATEHSMVKFTGEYHKVPPLMAHGVNNVYENGRYFIDGNADHVGLVRQSYRGVAGKLGDDESYGDVAYYGVDLGLSVGGLVSRSATLKPMASWNQLPHAKRFKLFRYTAEDYISQSVICLDARCPSWTVSGDFQGWFIAFVSITCHT